jgi:MFS family permease
MAPARGSTAADEGSSEDVGRRLVQERGIEPDPARVLREDPARMPLRRAAVYVLRIRTNVLVIVSSSIGYLFFSGLRTFGVSFARGHFSLSQALASILFTAAGAGALVGVVAGGRLSDRMLGRGRLEARILVAVLGYVAAGVVLVPSLLVTSLAIAFPLYLLGAAAFSAPNPALDAARLDVVPGALWGRAEGVRTTVRTLAQAAGPLVFGLIADALGGSHAAGTRDAFLIMLAPLALNGALLVPALRSYPRDMAGAMASEAALRRPPARP